MDRRTYLKRAAGVVVVGLAGCTESETPDAQPETSPTGTRGRTEPPTASPTDEPVETSTVSPTDTPTDSPTQSPTPRPEVAAEVTVAPDSDFRFSPETVTVGTGETVRWIWDSSNHNVKPADIPSDSDWTGSEGDRGTRHPEGHVHTHTFEVAGRYDYVCVPHESLGMTGTVVVE